MSVRVLVACDRCGNDPAVPLTVDLGPEPGPRRIDLCPACQDVVGLPRLVTLLGDYGIDIEKRPGPERPARPKPKPRPRLELDEPEPEPEPELEPALRRSGAGAWPCPECGKVLDKRAGALHHMVTVHTIEKAAASRLVPPPPGAKTAECEQCGFLGEAGVGIALHRKTHRPDYRR